MKKIFLLIMIPIALLTSCASDGPSYSANSIGQVSNIEQGKIIDIQVVNIKGNDNVGSRVGGMAGGLGGALAGSSNMLTSIAGSIGGAIVGGIAGGAAEKALTSSQAYQFVIQLKDGKSIAVLQQENKGLNVGDEVTILASGNNTRIVPLTSN